MASVGRAWIFVTILLTGYLAGVDAVRVKRQTSDDLEMPFLQGLQTTQADEGDQGDLKRFMELVSRALRLDGQEFADQGQSPDMDNVMRLVDTVQQTGKDGIEFQLTDGDPNDPSSPVISVQVETLYAEDLLASDKGRQQLSQLNAQLEQAMDSLSRSVQMMHGPDQEGKLTDSLQTTSAETMLGGMVNMLTGGDSWYMLLGMMGNQSLQAMNQLTQTLDQLPSLKGLLGKLYGLVVNLQTTNPSAARDMQQLMVNAIASLQGLNSELEQGGPMMEMERMLKMALDGLNANLELLEFIVNEIHQTVDNPSFLLVVNDTHCLLKSLSGDLSTDIAVGCLKRLMQAVAMMNQSEHVITTVVNSLTHVINSPHLLQSFADFMKMPSLDKAVSMIEMMMWDLDEANLDLAAAMQTLQTMLQGLLNNQPLLEALVNLLQNPESSQVYESVMQFLKDAALDDPLTQQLLQVVNDSISRLWQEGNAQSAVKTIEEILNVLKNDQDITESQQALLDLLNKLLAAAQNAANSETTSTQKPIVTTAKPADTTTKNDKTSRTTLSSATTRSTPSSSVHTTTEPRTKTTGNVEKPSSSAPTTRSPDTSDGNGSACVSVSAFTLFTVLLASTVWV